MRLETLGYVGIFTLSLKKLFLYKNIDDWVALLYNHLKA